MAFLGLRGPPHLPGLTLALYWLAFVVLAIVGVGAAGILLACPLARELLFIQGVMACVSVATIVLLHLRRTRLAGILFTGGCWAVLSFAVVTLGGTQSPAYFGYTAVVILAGAFLGVRAAVLCAACSLLFGLGVVGAESRGWLSAPWVEPGPIRRWYALGAEVLVGATFVYLVRRGVGEALRSARQSGARALAASHQTRRRLREQAIVARLSTRALRGRGREFMDECARGVRQMLGAECVHLLEGSRASDLRIVACANGSSLPVPAAELERASRALGRRVLENAEPLWFAGAEDHEGADVLGIPGIPAGCAVPIPGPGGVQGLLAAYGPDALRQTVPRLDMLRSVASLVAASWERERLEEQLREAHKLEAVGRLAAGVAHDFNNLLAVVVGNAELLLANCRDDARRAPMIRAIVDAAVRGNVLTRQLLTFSRQDAQEYEDFDPNDSARRLHGMLEALFQESLELELDLAPDIPSLRAGAGQFDQLLLNLVLNARDATPKGGSIRVRTRTLPAEEAVRHSPELAPRPYVLVSVKDRGTGMDHRTRERALEPFFTTKEPGHGTGLGLSIVYGIVQQLDGRLSIRSRPDAGTTIEIYLPVTGTGDQGSTRITTGPTPASTSPSRRARPYDRSTLRPAT